MKGSGEFNRRITIERAIATMNAFNEEILNWDPLVTVWANRRDASGTERYRSQEVGSLMTVRFTIRYSTDVADVNPADRILYDSRYYNIITVRETDRNRELEIDAVCRSDVEATVSSP